MRRIRKKLLAVFLMMAVTVITIPAGLVFYTDDVVAATEYSYTMSRPSAKIKGHTVHITTFTVSALGLKGSCAQAGTDAKTGKATVTKLSNTDIRTKLMYYYGYQKGYLGKTNMNGFLLGRALSWESGTTKLWPATPAEVKKFINAMPSSVSVPNRLECYFCNPTNGAQNFIAYKMNPPVYITLKKTSTNAFSTAAGSGYSFAGIEYSVYNSSGSLAGKLTCKANGTTNKLTLDTGTYTVKETKTNKWYKLNTQTYTKKLTSGQTWTISAKDSPQMGKVHIRKQVTGDYSGDLAFSFKLTNTANQSIVYKAVTDKNTGEADINVIEGTYRCEEILPDSTDLIDVTGMQRATVKIGGTYTFERENKVPSSGTLLISKSTNDGGAAAGFKFKVTGQLYNQGVMTSAKVLEEADVVLSDYDEELYQIGRWSVSEKDINELNEAAARMETGSKTVTLSNTLEYKGETGISILAFLKSIDDINDPKIKKGTIITDQSKTYRAKVDVPFDVAFVENEESEDIVRTEKTEGKEDTQDKADTQASDADEEQTIDAEKTEASIRALLSGESFEEINAADINVSAKVRVNLLPVKYSGGSETGDEAGYVTDLNRQISNKEQKSSTENGYHLTYNCFDWFGAATAYQEIKNGEPTGNTEVIVETGQDGTTEELKEGITYGKFMVSEVMTDAQRAKYRQPQTQVKEIKQQDGFAAFVFSFENIARWTGLHLVKNSDDGIVSGITFRLEGQNISGEKIDCSAVTDEEGRIDFGKLYAGEYVISETDFDSDQYEYNNKLDGYHVPAQKLMITGDETEDIEVSFNNVPLKSLYLTKVDKKSRIFLNNAVFALYEDKKELALFRLVLDDFGQAEIEMLRCDENSGLKTGTNATEGDEVKREEEETDYNYAVIRGLKEGRSYTIKEVTAPAGYAASVDHTFVFEDGQKLVMENAAPEISTSAVDRATKNQMSNADGMVTIVDTVSYSNLCPGHKYLISGVLALKHDKNRTVEEIERDAEEIQIVKDAKENEVTAQKEFIPKTENGTVNMEFCFDASLLDGKQVVAMEQLVDPALTGVNGVITVVASHEDIEDEAQTIYFPQVETEAAADDTGKPITEADSYITITDTVDYSNVIAGKIYEIKGTLMDKKTGKPLLSGGSKITSTVRFKAGLEGPVFAAEGEELKEETQSEVELVSGTVELKFTFDGSELGGKGAVAFEQLFTGKSLVGEHSDINDEKQTVYLPVIETTAATNGTDMVSDKVEYRNLLPGEKYIMRGQLMDKATGKELIVDGRDFTSQMEFVPDRKNGSVMMEFPVDAKALKGKTAVAFEVCSIVNESEDGVSETVVISHRDINNKAQTVSFDVPQTGQSGPWMLLLPVGALPLAAIYLVLRFLRRAGRI